jgi:peptidoglycan/LPS O-acetylase OafA/YrhL
MFGSFRFLLAWMVVLSHLWTHASLWAGPYAVFGFYLLSGFLMAMVLHSTYGHSPGGMLRFFANRALRIYPPYLAAAVISLLVIALIPETLKGYNRTMQVPDTFAEWLRNIFIIGLNAVRGVDPRLPPASLVPPAWSIDIELCFYLLLGLGIGRGPRIALTWALLSVLWAVWLIADDANFTERYRSLAAASLPFALGACLFHFRARISEWLHRPWHLPVALTLFLVNAGLPHLIWAPLALTEVQRSDPEFYRLVNSQEWRDVFLFGFYASLLATLYCVAVLCRYDPRRAPPWLSRLDTLLGNLSYPVFLCHWQAGAIVIALGLAESKGRELFLWSLLAIPLLATAIHLAVEHPLERWRNQVRGRTTKRRAPAANSPDGP